MDETSPWPSLLRTHMQRNGFLQDDFAPKVKRSQPAISDLCNGKTLPPLSEITDFADVLELRGTERSTFIEEAYLAHAPDVVRCMLIEHRALIIRLERYIKKNGLDPGEA